MIWMVLFKAYVALRQGSVVYAAIAELLRGTVLPLLVVVSHVYGCYPVNEGNQPVNHHIDESINTGERIQEDLSIKARVSVVNAYELIAPINYTADHDQSESPCSNSGSITNQIQRY